MAELVLASGSPRRAALLSKAGYSFAVARPAVDETIPASLSPLQAALHLAALKARAVAVPGAWILAADTLGDLDGRALAKPTDADDARQMLRALSGRAHEVVTGVAVRTPLGAMHTGVARSVVRFRALQSAQIDAYVATGEPLDKAGAYAIQGGAAEFVERVDGPQDNVVGLPMGIVTRLLREAGFPLA